MKQLLYPEYLNKMNLSLVKIRHHKTECIIMTKTSACRFSMVNCDSENESDSDSESDKSPRRVAADKSSSDSSSSSNPFGYIRYYNPQTGSHAEIENKYESFIDYGEPVSGSEPQMVEDQPKTASVTLTATAKLKLTHQTSESSDASSYFAPKPFMACEDLRSINENLPVASFSAQKLYVPTTRQSLPTKFVGDRFCQSSLTTIDIPQWQSSSDNQLHCASKKAFLDTSSCSTTTHSSSLDLEVNPVPLPDNVVAELLYNFDEPGFTKSESIESDKTFRTVIKPTVLQNKSANQHSSDSMSLSLENIGFRKHSINSDKLKRRSSIHVNRAAHNNPLRRCVSSHFVQMGGCCTEMCQSPRSSDSGMAGSCTLNSPDFGGTEQGRCSIDVSNIFHKHGLFDNKSLTLSEIEARDFNSQCPCTSPFGSTPRTSCQTSISDNVMTGSHDSMRTTSVTSLDIALMQPWETEPKIHSKLVNVTPKMLPSTEPRCIEKWEPSPKSKSLDCINDNSNSKCSIDDGEEKGAIYRSGLYAHWWLKAKIPASVVKGIYEETRSPNTGKGVF